MQSNQFFKIINLLIIFKEEISVHDLKPCIGFFLFASFEIKFIT